MIAFFRAFEGMEAGFRDRANQVMTLLGAPETSFVLVTTPRRDAVEEGEYFADRLTEHGMAVEALIVNRVHPHYGLDAPERAPSCRPTALGNEPGRGRGSVSPPATRTSPTWSRWPSASVASWPDSKSAWATPRSRTCPSSTTTCSTSPRCVRSRSTWSTDRARRIHCPVCSAEENDSYSESGRRRPLASTCG